MHLLVAILGASLNPDSLQAQIPWLHPSSPSPMAHGSPDSTCIPVGTMQAVPTSQYAHSLL